MKNILSKIYAVFRWFLTNYSLENLPNLKKASGLPNLKDFLQNSLHAEVTKIAKLNTLRFGTGALFRFGH